MEVKLGLGIRIFEPMLVLIFIFHDPIQAPMRLNFSLW